MKYFTCDRVTGEVEIEETRILAIKEFKALLEPKRNITTEDKKGLKRTLAKKELVFIFLYLDWDSPYFKYSEADRKEVSLQDSGLTEDHFKDEDFVRACQKYDELYNQMVELRLLKSSMNAIEKIIYYLENVDMNERKEDNTPVFKTKDIIAEIKGAKDLISSIRDLEDDVKKGLVEESNVRGSAELGFFD